MNFAPGLKMAALPSSIQYSGQIVGREDGCR